MLQVTLNVRVEKIKDLILQSPAHDIFMLMDAIEEPVETVAMMQLAQTGFEKWNEEGEDVYNA